MRSRSTRKIGASEVDPRDLALKSYTAASISVCRSTDVRSDLAHPVNCQIFRNRYMAIDFTRMFWSSKLVSVHLVLKKQSPYRRAGRLVGLAMSASRSCPSSTPSGDDCGRPMHRICKRVPWCESILAPVAHRLKRFKIDGADFRSDHLHDSSSDVLSRTVSLSLPNAIATQRGIARTQAQRWTCSAAHELQVHR